MGPLGSVSAADLGEYVAHSGVINGQHSRRKEMSRIAAGMRKS